MGTSHKESLELYSAPDGGLLSPLMELERQLQQQDEQQCHRRSTPSRLQDTEISEESEVVVGFIHLGL